MTTNTSRASTASRSTKTKPASTKTKKAESNGKKALAPSPTLGAVAAAEGIAALRALHRRHGIIPARSVEATTTTLETLDRVLTGASVLDLVECQAKFLQMLTGTPAGSLTRYHDTETSERLHTMRNLLVAVAALGAHTIDPAIGSPGTSPAAVYHNSVRLKRRTAVYKRPMTDDEILLCRVAAHLALLHDPRDTQATRYVLLDAGLTPGETTSVTIADFDDQELPTQVLAPGNRNLAPRFLTLDRFVAHVLTWHIDAATRAGHQPDVSLTYRPRKTSHKSNPQQASAQRSVDKFLAELGIPTGDLTAGSIIQWRVETVLDTQGPREALAASGRSTYAQMYRALGQYGPTTSDLRHDDAGISFASAV